MLERLDDHIIAKKDILLRPSASRRFLFRGTPGGQVTIRVGTKHGPNLPDTEEPVDDAIVRPGRAIIGEPVDDSPRFTPVGDFIARSARLTTTDDTPVRRNAPSLSTTETARLRAHLIEALSTGVGGTPGEGGVILMDTRPWDHSILTLGSSGELVVVGPGDPRPPPDVPRPPMRVRVSVQNGPILRDETVTVPDGVQAPAQVKTAGPFPGHDIIEVTYTNPNDFPVLFYTFINVQNDLTQTTTVLTRTMLERVFRDTLMFLAPSFGIRDGRLFFAFSDEVRHTFGIDPIVKDIGVDADVTVNIEPVGFDLLNHEFVIRRMVSEMEAEIRAVQSPVLNLPPVPSDFVAQAVDAFFSPALISLPYLFGQMGLHEIQWMAALSRRPLLGGSPRLTGERDDAALRFHLRMTEIIVGASRLELNVDTITATLYVVLRSGSRPEPHPVRSLPDDFVRAGYILPRFHLTVDISDIDINIDLPGGAVTKPFEFIAEKGLEEVADWIKDDLEEEVVKEGIAYLEDVKLDIGAFTTSIMREIANRAHVFRRLFTDNRGWVIETLDPAQLAVPFVEPDDVDHRFDDINDNLAPVEPIDGPMPADATERLGRVDHLVFLMMENRSFDHMLGYLSHPNHGNRSDVNGLDGRSIQLGGDFTGTVATPQPRPRLSFAPDPGHGVETVAAQIADGAMDGFVSEFARRLYGSDEINPRGNLNDPERILKFYTADQLESYDRLTRTDMVLDRWFCSFPGATYPNRTCYYTGFSPVLTNSEVFDDAGYITDLTLFEVLDHEAVDWIVYESDISFLRVFESYRLERGRIRPIEELFTRTQALPPVTFIDPNFTGVPSAGPANDDHPTTDVTAGQEFIAHVISTLQDLPSWPTTMLVILYDEHGGFADHVPPPGTSRSDFPLGPDGSLTVPLAHPDVASYGPRVPAFVVSPVITAGGVGHRIYDHATVYRTIIERFMPKLRNSSIFPERVRRARHLGELVELGSGGLSRCGSRQPRSQPRQRFPPSSGVTAPATARTSHGPPIQRTSTSS